MSVRAPIVEKLGLLKKTLATGFQLTHRYNLGMVINQFCLGKHTSTARKLPKVCVNQHQIISGSGGSPTLADAAYTTATDGFSLLETISMVWNMHTRLQVILETLLGRYHTSAQGMYADIRDLIYQETELEEYSPCEPCLKPKLPAFLTRWVHIHLLDWIYRQWEMGGR